MASSWRRVYSSINWMTGRRIGSPCSLAKKLPVFRTGSFVVFRLLLRPRLRHMPFPSLAIFISPERVHRLLERLQTEFQSGAWVPDVEVLQHGRVQHTQSTNLHIRLGNQGAFDSVQRRVGLGLRRPVEDFRRTSWEVGRIYGRFTAGVSQEPGLSHLT